MNPKARETDLLIDELPDETLVYDRKRHKAFCLNRTTTLVWRRCDGKTAPDEIARVIRDDIVPTAPVDAETACNLVRLALARLDAADLLVNSPEATGAVYSRRELARNLARVAGVVTVLLPTVMAVNVPAVVSAGSCVSEDDCAKHPKANQGRCCCDSRKICDKGTPTGPSC